MMNFIPAMSELSRISPYIPIGIAVFGVGGAIMTAAGLSTHNASRTVFGAYATVGAILLARIAMRDVKAFKEIFTTFAHASRVQAIAFNATCFIMPLITSTLTLYCLATV